MITINKAQMNEIEISVSSTSNDETTRTLTLDEYFEFNKYVNIKTGTRIMNIVTDITHFIVHFIDAYK